MHARADEEVTVPETWTGEWSIPVFSLQERDQRWAAVRCHAGFLPALF